MLNKQDVLSILVYMEDSTQINVNEPMQKLMTSKDIPIDVLKFIVKNKGLELSNFYEMLRKKHNQNKSPLYTNILRCEESKQDVVTTLICLLTQIILYSNRLDTGKDRFLKEVRAEEISRVINKYFVDGSIAGCNSILKLIKTDLLVVEGLAGRRDFE